MVSWLRTEAARDWIIIILLAMIACGVWELVYK